MVDARGEFDLEGYLLVSAGVDVVDGVEDGELIDVEIGFLWYGAEVSCAVNLVGVGELELNVFGS